MKNLEKMLSEVRRYVDRDLQIRKEKRKRGECFNIFEVLGISHKETITHSPFLVELLNPKGCHGCESTFLKAFLEIVLHKSFTAEELGKAKVSSEKSIGNKNEDATEGGRLDIQIIIGTSLIIIENKIDAEEQKNQLLRYYNHAESEVKKGSTKDYKLLYLTLFGNEASEFSTGGKLKAGEHYCTISYSRDILSWLECCKAISIDKPLVRETLTQYITVIKKLTNQDMEEKEKEQMFAEMEKYPEAVAGIFHVGFKEFRNYLFKKYCEPKFEEEARKRNLIYKGTKACIGAKESGFYFTKWEYAGIYIWTDNWDHDYYISISFDGDNTPKKVREKVSKEALLDEKPEDWWPKGRTFLPESLNWKNSSILPSFKSGKYVENIMEEIDKVLKIIEDNHIELP